MRKLWLAFIFLFASVAHGQVVAAVSGNCNAGNVKASVSGLQSTNTLVGSYPLCTVTVFNTGTIVTPTIYANSSLGALSNPFTANADGSWLFYAPIGLGYDVTMSGGTPIAFPSTVTITDVIPGGQAPGSPSTSVQYNCAGLFCGSAALEWINGTSTLNATNLFSSGKISANNIEGVLYADQASGSDCGAKINAQDSALGGTAGEIWVNQNCGLTSTTAVAISTNHILRFNQCGTYTFPSITGTTGSGIYGDGPCTVIKSPSTASQVNLVSTTGSSTSSNATLASNANEGTNVVALTAGSVSSLGLGAGDIIQLQDTSSPVREQVARIASISGDTLTLDDPLALAFITANSAFVVKIINPVKGFVISDIAIDASLATATNSRALLVQQCAWCRVEGVLTLGSGGGGIYFFQGYQNVGSNLNVQNGGNVNEAAFLFNQQTRSQLTNVNVNHLPSTSFGFIASLTHLSQVTNLSIGAQEPSGGRGFKTATSSYDSFVNLEADNAVGTFNGISITGGSNHNQLTNCKALNNSGVGITTFGDNNQYNSFVNCTAKFNTQNQVLFNLNDNHNEIIGGEFGDARGAACDIVSGSVSFIMTGATLVDDNGTATCGLGFSTSGVSSVTVIGNNFSGFPSNTDITLSGTNVTKSNFINNQTPDGNTHDADNTNNWIGNIGDGPGVSSGAGAPSGNCPTGSLYLNSSAADASHVAYVCQGNTWTAVSAP